MAGHSKWANIQHRKGRQDAVRSKLFSKLSKEITVAAKLGDKEKSKALKRLHQVAKAGEAKGTPIDFLNDLIDHEWDHAEKNRGKTFMGNVVKGLTRSIMNTQNKVLYGNDRK